MYRIRWTRVLALSAALGALVLLLRGCAIACGAGGADAAPRVEALPGATVRVYDAQAGGVEERLLEEYLVGVVAAEMPASFHEQALRAQAVAARTYTAYRAAHGGCGAHDGADVCTSSACCQAYATDEALRARIQQLAQQKNTEEMKYYTVVTVDHSYAPYHQDEALQK